jgi:putative ABC transport system permease protein
VKRGARALLLDIRDGVRAQPGRMGLAFLAIGVGVAALTLLLAVLGGLKERSRRIVHELGINVFGIVPAPHSAMQEGNRLTGRQVAFLAANLPDCLVAGYSVHEVQAAGAAGAVKVVAADSALSRVRTWTLAAGRFLDPRDDAAHARVAVISAALSRRWDWKIGGTIVLNDMPYETVGVVDGGGGAMDNEMAEVGVLSGDQVVVVPRGTPPYWQISGEPSPYLDGILVRVPDGARFMETLACARRLLAQPGGEYVEQPVWVTPEVLLRKVRRLQDTIALTVGSIAALCLVLGGTTLMSLMVANVRDRVTEIGLRTALGATPRDIAGLFVAEGALVAAAAGLVATAGTHLLLLAGNGRLPVPVAVDAATVALPALVAVGLGIVFSYWPARTAARIMPAEALRND